MKISPEKLLGEAQAAGFRPEVMEKIFHLLTLLDGFTRHPFLKGRLALKGGTALNLFCFDLPRLSVDIDLNYIGAADRETMAAERPKVEQAVHAVCSREGMHPTRVPTDHAGGKWRLRYDSGLGEGGNLDLEKLRLGFVIYGAMNRKDWRTVRIEDVGYDPKELENELVPVIRNEF